MNNASEPPRSFRLLCVHGAHKDRVFALGEQPALIGRDPKATILHSDAMTSRLHCQVEMAGDGHIVRDLNSRNGTFLNGRRISTALLSAGDVIRAGEQSYLFMEDATPSHSRPAVQSPRRFQLSTFEGFEIVGDSAPFQQCMQLAEKYADSDLPVLVAGEAGVGKDLVARWIHRRSSAATGSFVHFDCAAIPESVCEVELFGVDRTSGGGRKRRRGALERAAGGTLFLDEIGALPVPMQSKLAGAIADGQASRFGGQESVPVEARIVASTHRDLNVERNEGRFDDHLRQLLVTLAITVPPLRERDEDVLLLAEHFVSLVSQRLWGHARQLSAAARQRLANYQWPGNVRELYYVIERGVGTTRTDIVDAADLPLPTLGIMSAAASLTDTVIYDFTLHGAERAAIERALRQTAGDVDTAADLLDISRPSLRHKIDGHGIDAQAFRV